MFEERSRKGARKKREEVWRKRVQRRENKDHEEKHDLSLREQPEIPREGERKGDERGKGDRRRHSFPSLFSRLERYTSVCFCGERKDGDARRREKEQVSGDEE